jgi:outer membrane protein OmpA-like peptidoglycan-associated protein
MKTIFSKSLACLSLAALLSSVALTGCSNMSGGQKSAATGAVIGALAGAAIGDSKGSAAAGAAIGALGGYIWNHEMEKKKRAMEQATAGTGATVTQTPDNQLKVNIPSDFSFDINSYAIKPVMRPVLDQLASGLPGQNVDVRIIGHTDNTGTYQINQPLSENRAMSVRNYLIGKGIDGSRINTSGVADSQPAASNATAAGRAQNRRVEIYLGQRG